MKTVLTCYESKADRAAALASIAAHASSTAMTVTAYTQIATWSPPDPETGEAAMITPAIIADGYWLLAASEAGQHPLRLPEGIVAVAPLFAGMADPV